MEQSPSPNGTSQESQQEPAASTSTAAPAGSPPPLPFDPTKRQPAPTLGSVEQRPQGQQGDVKESGKFPGARTVAKWGGLGLLALVVTRCAFGGPASTTVINQVPGAPSSTSTTEVAQVPLRAVPVGAQIGGFPVRDSALMVINGEVQTASVAALDYIARNPGVGVCNLYVGAKFGAESGYTFSGARTEDAEVKLVDCKTGPDGPVATTVPVQDSVPTTTTPAPAGG